MPRKRKKPPADSPAAEPTTLDELAESHGLVTADQLPEPVAEAPPRFTEIIRTRPTGPRARDINQPSQIAKYLDSRVPMPEVPAGWVNVYSCPVTGIRVNKSLDRQWAAIQFPEGETPTPDEKALLLDLETKDESLRRLNTFQWSGNSRQWVRKWHGNDLGMNVWKAKETVMQIGEMRSEGRGR